MIDEYPKRLIQAATGADGVLRDLNRDDVAGNRSLFNELIITERTPLIELNSALGISVLRDKVTVTNTGTVTNADGEHILSTGATTASTAQIQTQEHGRYYPGNSSEQGMGIRAPGTYTGTAFSEWGYFGATDGFGFGIDATGFYLFYTRDSIQTKVRQADWGLDVMDGTGPSGTTLVQGAGNIYRVNFSWYGYGAVEWGIIKDNAAGRQTEIVVHRYRPTEENSIRNPNQPITTKISNGNTTADHTLYLGGRQYAIYAKYIPSIRRTPETRLQRTGVGTTFVPLITFRRKANKEGFPVKFQEIDVVTSSALVWEIRIGSTLTGASFGAITNIPATETALEVDIAASAIANGQKIEAGLIATSGSGGNASGGFSATSFALELPGTTEITLCVRTITGTATVDAIMGMEEEW
jgi:hypothetical protein